MYYYMQMELRYYRSRCGIKLTLHNAANVTGYSEQKLIQLTGAHAKHENITHYEIERISGVYPKLLITTTANSFTLTRRLNFDTGIITNQFFFVNREFQGQGIAAHILNAQVHAARAMGFIKLRLDAWGSRRDKEFNGYYTWARLGFSPIDNGQYLFNEILKLGGKEGISLQEYLADPENRTYWKYHAGNWEGEFILDEHSINSVHLNNYLKEHYFE